MKEGSNYISIEEYLKEQAERRKEPMVLLGEGLESVDRVLLKYNAPGVLFGSALSLLYNPHPRKRFHDLDVLLLSSSCDNHPVLREGTKYDFECSDNTIHIDWWVTHDTSFRPHNDNEWKKMQDPGFDVMWHGKPLVDLRDAVGLYWYLQPKKELAPGLKVLSPDLAKKLLEYELSLNPKIKKYKEKIEKRLRERWRVENYHFSYPLISEEEVDVKLYNKSNTMDVYCKTCYSGPW